MNKVLNLLLTITVFFGGWKLFPNIFWFESTGAVVITVLIKYGISILLGILLFLILLGAFSILNDMKKIILAGILTLLVAFILNVLEVVIISKLYSGFQFNGGLLELLVTGFALSLFSVNISTNSKKD